MPIHARLLNLLYRPVQACLNRIGILLKPASLFSTVDSPNSCQKRTAECRGCMQQQTILKHTWHDNQY